jgi:hypothetical protein
MAVKTEKKVVKSSLAKRSLQKFMKKIGYVAK